MIRISIIGCVLALAAPALAAGNDADIHTGDPSKGKLLFVQCASCHALTADGRQKIGPALEGLFGRVAGSQEDYAYSPVFQDADFAWTKESLDAFLKRPTSYMPGTYMAFAGVRSDGHRSDLIAYLKEATGADGHPTN